jgi:hypothetical protein
MLTIPEETRLTLPTPIGKSGLVKGANSELNHTLGLSIIKGIFITKNTKKITTNECSDL